MELQILVFLVLSLEIPRLSGHIASVCATLKVIHDLEQKERDVSSLSPTTESFPKLSQVLVLTM